GIGSPRTGALDGPGLDLAIIDNKEPLRGDREHGPAAAEIQKRAALGRAGRAKPQIERPEMALQDPSLQPPAEVHLEDLAAGDTLHDVGNRRFEAAEAGPAHHGPSGQAPGWNLERRPSSGCGEKAL